MTSRTPLRMSGTQAAAILIWPARTFVWLSRFGHMIAELRHPPPTAAADATGAAAYYAPMLDRLALPDEQTLPLHPRFEKRSAQEGEIIRRVARMAASTVIANYCDLKERDSAARALRDQHAKQHGCLRASFVVASDLPAEFETSLFRRGARYDALVRLSNAQGKPQNDRTPDGRGIAIKLLGIEGGSLLDSLAVPLGEQAASRGEQDFLLTNFPVFFGKNVEDYAEFIGIVSAPAAPFTLASLRRALKAARFLLVRPRQLWIFARTALQQVSDPLQVTYHSMTAYQFGYDRVVRYIVSPAGNAAPRPWPLFPWTGGWSLLRKTMAARLDPQRAHAATSFHFSICLRAEPTPDDVEDASRYWSRPADREILLARIEIPAQQFDTARQFLFGENLSFNPWRCLPEHRPLGGLNRMRLAVYLASFQARRLLNLAGAGVR